MSKWNAASDSTALAPGFRAMWTRARPVTGKPQDGDVRRRRSVSDGVGIGVDSAAHSPNRMGVFRASATVHSSTHSHPSSSSMGMPSSHTVHLGENTSNMSNNNNNSTTRNYSAHLIHMLHRSNGHASNEAAHHGGSSAAPSRDDGPDGGGGVALGAPTTTTITSLPKAGTPAPRYPRPRFFAARRKVMNVALTKYKVIRTVAAELDFDIHETEVELDKYGFNLCWSDTVLPLTRLVRLANWQRTNHFPAMYLLCRKSHLGRTLSGLRRRIPHEFNFYPRTWMMRCEQGHFRDYLARRQIRGKRIPFFIMKPNSGCQGRGIIVTRDPVNAVDDLDNYIVQEYIARPMLIEGRKFDLRVYVLLMSIREPSIFMFNDGLVRMCAESYHTPSDDNAANSCMHLTNYAVNKRSAEYVFNTDASRGDVGNKRNFRFLNRWLAEQQHDVTQFWQQVGAVVAKTILAAQPQLSHVYNNCFSTANEGYSCFEILGFDVLVDSKARSWLVEVNHTPSFATDTPLDMDIKHRLITETCQIVNCNADDCRREHERVRNEFNKRNIPPWTQIPVVTQNSKQTHADHNDNNIHKNNNSEYSNNINCVTASAASRLSSSNASAAASHATCADSTEEQPAARGSASASSSPFSSPHRSIAHSSTALAVEDEYARHEEAAPESVSDKPTAMPADNDNDNNNNNNNNNRNSSAGAMSHRHSQTLRTSTTDSTEVQLEVSELVRSQRAREDSQLRDFVRVYPSSDPAQQRVYDAIRAQARQLKSTWSSLPTLRVNSGDMSHYYSYYSALSGVNANDSVLNGVNFSNAMSRGGGGAGALYTNTRSPAQSNAAAGGDAPLPSNDRNNNPVVVNSMNGSSTLANSTTKAPGDVVAQHDAGLTPVCGLGSDRASSPSPDADAADADVSAAPTELVPNQTPTQQPPARTATALYATAVSGAPIVTPVSPSDAIASSESIAQQRRSTSQSNEAAACAASQTTPRPFFSPPLLEDDALAARRTRTTTASSMSASSFSPAAVTGTGVVVPMPVGQGSESALHPGSPPLPCSASPKPLRQKPHAKRRQKGSGSLTQGGPVAHAGASTTAPLLSRCSAMDCLCCMPISCSIVNCVAISGDRVTSCTAPWIPCATADTPVSAAASAQVEVEAETG